MTRIYPIIALIILHLYPTSGFSQKYDYLENAVYVYNFIKYTEWPSKKTNIQIGVIGNSPVEVELKKLLAKKKNGVPSFSIRKITINESTNVDVIVLSEAETSQIKSINKMTQNLPILVITERGNLARLGACISFFINEENNFKTEFQLSLRNCKQRKLYVSDQILNNAVLIR